jgi:hypothetical protein
MNHNFLFFFGCWQVLCSCIAMIQIIPSQSKFLILSVLSLPTGVAMKELAVGMKQKGE